MDDASLIALLFERDEAAVSELDLAYGKYCFAIAINMLRSKEDAEEVVNDVYQRVWQSIPPSQPDNLRAYLAKITRNLAYNRIEATNADKRRAGVTLVYDELDEVLPARDENLLDRMAIGKVLNAFLESLEANDRILFVKRYFYNEEYETLARFFGTTKSAVKMKLYRLRKQLKRLLENEGVYVKESI